MNNFKQRLGLIFLLFLMGSFALAQETKEETKAASAMDTFLDAEKFKMLEDYPQATKLYEKTLEIDAEYDPAMFELARLYLFEQRYQEALMWMEKAYQIDATNKWYALLLIDLYRNNYQIADAIAIYGNLLELEPNNTDYLMSLSGLYHSIDDYKNALKCLEKIEKLEGVSEKISLQKRNLYMQEKDFEKAVGVMITLSDAFPKEEKYCSMIAEMYMQENQPDKALPWYEKVIALNPDNPYIQITLADFYSKKGDLKKAYDYLKQGYSNPNLDIDTKVQVLLNYLAASTENIIMKERTYELSEILVATHPNEAKSHAIYGDLLFQDSLYIEAAREFEKTIAIDSSRYAVWNQLIYSLSMAQQDSLAAIYSIRAIALFPQMEFPYYIAALSYYQQENTAKVIEILEQGMYFVTNPGLKEQFYSFLGDAYHQENQDEKSYEAYDNALALNPDNSFVLNNYAYYLANESKNLDKAKEMASHAVELEPNANNLDTYGWVLFKMGNYTEAQKYIEQSLEESEIPSSEVLEHMGDVLYFNGKVKKARSFWKKAKKADGSAESLDQKINGTYWNETE